MLKLPKAVIRTYIAQAEKQERRDDEDTERERIRIGLELLMFFAVVATGVFAYWNWQALEKSNSLARRAYETSQRAYVTVSTLDLKAVPGSGGFWRATPVLMNSGNTPTKNMWWMTIVDDSCGVASRVVPAFTPECGDYPHLQIAKDVLTASRNRLALGPRESISLLGMSIPVPPHYVAGLRGSAEFYVNGLIFYEDFLTPEKHVTRFCFALWHNQAVTGPDLAFSQCAGAGANCTDEECKDYKELIAATESKPAPSDDLP